MERADLMQQGIGTAEAREDDEAQHQAAELEWALTKMERAITRWETATHQTKKDVLLFQHQCKHNHYTLLAIRLSNTHTPLVTNTISVSYLIPAQQSCQQLIN